MIEIGTYCIHKSRYGEKPCRVIAYDGVVVVIKEIGSGYRGVLESSLTPTTQESALKKSPRSLRGK